MEGTAAQAAARPSASFRTCRRAMVSTAASVSGHTAINERGGERFLRGLSGLPPGALAAPLPAPWSHHALQSTSGALGCQKRGPPAFARAPRKQHGFKSLYLFLRRFVFFAAFAFAFLALFAILPSMVGLANQDSTGCGESHFCRGAGFPQQSIPPTCQMENCLAWVARQTRRWCRFRQVFGETRVAWLALLTLTELLGSRSCGVAMAQLSGHAVTFRSSPTVFADTRTSPSTSTRILFGRPARAMWSASTLFGL